MNNKNSIIKFQIFSTILTMILGTLLHFTFEWSNNNLFVASFSSINESTWEHLKLLFFPMLLTIIIGFLYFDNDFSRYLCAKTFGIISAVLFTTIFFYTYTGILGTNITFFNIGSFFIAVLLGEFITYKIFTLNYSCNSKLSFILLILLLLCLVIFTYFPPQINFFKDPLTGQFGIINN